MNILFPCNPLEPREVDPDFAEQAAAGAAAGFSTWLLSFEALVHEHAPSRAVRRIPEDTGPCLYRGWMLKPPAYAELAGALEARLTPLVVTPAAWRASTMGAGRSWRSETVRYRGSAKRTPSRFSWRWLGR